MCTLRKGQQDKAGKSSDFGPGVSILCEAVGGWDQGFAGRSLVDIEAVAGRKGSVVCVS